MTGKGLVIIKGQGFDEGGWNPAQPLGDPVGNAFGFPAGYLLQGCQQRGSIGHHQQSRFVGLTHHQIDFDIAEAGTFLDHFGALSDRQAACNGSPAICSIASFALAGAMFEVFVEVLVGWIFRLFRCPNPLLDGLVGDPIDAHHSPAAADQLRGKFLLGQPPAGLGFEL